MDGKKGIHPSVGVGILSVLLIFIFLFMLINASTLRAALHDSTENYALDMSSQLAGDISSRMKAVQMEMKLMADSISMVSGTDKELAEFIERKSEISGFDAMAFLGADGRAVPADFSSSMFQEGIDASFRGEMRVTAYTEGQNVLYTVPVYQDNQITGVLAGLRNKANMQALIQPTSFEGRGLTCIVDSDGKVIISPTDIKPFLTLDTIFNESGKSEVSRAVMEMKEDLENRKEGVFRFTAVNGEELFLSHHALTVNDWTLLTLIPADLISGQAEKYIFYSFLIIGSIVVIFGLFIFAVSRFYSKSRKRLEQIAYVDSVTGGRNNAAFHAMYRKLAETELPPFAVVLLNIKNFKLINENFGTEQGDKTLRYVYETLSGMLKPGEIVARSSADNFFLCLKEHSREVISARLEEMTKELNRFNELIETPYHLTVLKGAYIVEDLSLDITIIQDRARMAYQSRMDGENTDCAFYDAVYTERMKEEQELEQAFEPSLENHDFTLYLQPKVRLKDGQVGGAEALVRWNHPERGMISPGMFIPLFEQSDKICRLDRYMFEQACVCLERWIKSGNKPIPISVNLSRRHFDDPNFLTWFSETAKRHNIPNGLMEFELTESIFFDNFKINIVKQRIRQMHELGFQCSLDDFGSGYSSLGLVKEFDIDAIKLDRRFFKDIEDQKSRDVIDCLITLSKKLGLTSVAEGIETEEQLSYMQTVGCDLVQGFIFSRPLPVEEFETWWEKKNRGTS